MDIPYLPEILFGISFLVFVFTIIIIAPTVFKKDTGEKKSTKRERKIEWAYRTVSRSIIKY